MYYYESGHEISQMGIYFSHSGSTDLVFKYCSHPLCLGLYFSVSISFYRWLIAFIILTPFMFLSVWRQRRLVIPYLPKLAVLSAFGMVLYQGLAYTAAHYTSATNMGIVNAFIPIFTIFVSLAILKDVPNRFAVLAVFCLLLVCYTLCPKEILISF